MKYMKELILNHEIYFDEYITGNRFIDICDQTKAKFCKVDYIKELSNSNIDLLVTHNSDYSINNSRFSLLSKNVNKWLAQNKSIDSNLIEAIPIGLENMILRVTPESRLGLHSSQIPNAILKARYIDKKAKEKIEHKKLIYLNISAKTNYNERMGIINNFKDRHWVTYESNVSWKEYYDSISAHKFVFSPAGNGIDCHRTWESLYLRTIPVVKTSVCMNSFSELPILFVNDWGEVSPSFLNEKYEEITNRKYDLSKLKISYWKKYIQDYFNE